MGQIHQTRLRELLMQAQYAPLKQKLLQLDAADTLLGIIQPAKSYPFDFICFHLTGYRPRPDALGGDLISYKCLLADLPEYILQLSRPMKIPAAALTQKYFTLEMLSRKFRVSAKTIGRWRKQGLAGRYVVFGDSRSRLAFPETLVKLFVNRNRRKVLSRRNLTKLTPAQATVIVARLIKWAHYLPEDRQEALRRTARKFGRSLETVRNLLLEHEKRENRPLFAKRPTGISPQEQREICNLHEQGAPLAELIRRFGRSRTNIYRAITLEQAARLCLTPIFYMPAPQFSQPEAEKYLHEPENPARESLRATAPVLSRRSDVSKPENLKSKIEAEPNTRSRPLDLNTYVEEIARYSMLTALQEQFLFGRYNYLKYRAAQLQKEINPRDPLAGAVRELRTYLLLAQKVKEQLLCANLRLVVSTARKHTRSEGEMLDLISEGNLALINAVEKFDFTRGFKFSTYATWAIVKRFASYRGSRRNLPEFVTADEALEVATDLRVADNRILALESARKSLRQAIAEALEERERIIVEEHYGLAEQKPIPGQRKARSLSQISALVGLSKERIRQIEMLALSKLRKLLSPEQFEILLQA